MGIFWVSAAPSTNDRLLYLLKDQVDFVMTLMLKFIISKSLASVILCLLHDPMVAHDFGIDLSDDAKC